MSTDTTKISITTEPPKVQRVSSSPVRAKKTVENKEIEKQADTNSSREVLLAQLKEKKEEYKDIQNLVKKDKFTYEDKVKYSRMRHPIKNKAAKIGEIAAYAGMACGIFITSGIGMAVCLAVVGIGVCAAYNCEDFIKKEALRVSDEEVKNYYNNRAAKLLAEIKEIEAKTQNKKFVVEI